jgi:hypothetical protein
VKEVDEGILVVEVHHSNDIAQSVAKKSSVVGDDQMIDFSYFHLSTESSSKTVLRTICADSESFKKTNLICKKGLRVLIIRILQG